MTRGADVDSTTASYWCDPLRKKYCSVVKAVGVPETGEAFSLTNMGWGVITTSRQTYLSVTLSLGLLLLVGGGAVAIFRLIRLIWSTAAVNASYDGAVVVA